MHRLFRLSALALLTGALAVFSTADASAALTKDQQKCVNALNKGLGKVAKTIGKEVGACIKDFAKGAGVTDLEACINQDRKGKILKATQKAVADDTKACDGLDKDGAPRRPPVFATDAATINAAALAKELGVLEAILGTDADGTLITEATDKDASKCQQKIAKDALKCQSTKLKAFAKCKKTALQGGAMVEADIEACVFADPKGKIAKSCGKVAADMAKQCADKGVDLCAAFPHCCPPCTSGDATCVAACVEEPVECETCLAINTADDLDADCDALDNGAVDGSCSTLTIIGAHKCQLDPSQSQVLVDLGFTQLIIPGNGSIDIDCGVVDPNTGKAACDCSLQSFTPFSLGAIGFVCITPAAGCPTGEIDCDGGNGLDTDLVVDHTIGTCTSQADCEAQCATTCGANEPFNPRCEGFCFGGSNDGGVCTNDSECPGGNCPGPNGGHVTSNQCQCGCLERGLGTSRAGGLQCDVGANIGVESAAPCDGADVTINVGKTCIPLSTEAATGVIVNANMGAGTLPSSGAITLTGTPANCSALANSVSTGMKAVGFVGFFDSTLGDIAAMLTFSCQ